MEQFVVSARKYRPGSFASVVGQEHITTTLKNAIASGHLAQAFLFCGPRGVGKTTCARILAKTINCENLQENIEACNECTTCKSFIEGSSFNIHELDAASNNSVEDIRSLVEQVRYPPQSGRYKIYIIDEVHMLSNAAFNAFLKTLEEPPPYAIFILATTEKHKIIPTILSRCQIFDFNRIGVQSIAGHLKEIAERESIGTEEDALHLIAEKAEGGMRDALSLFDLLSTYSEERQITYNSTIENLHILDYDYYFRITQALLNSEHAEALVILHEIMGKGFDGHLILSGLADHFRSLLLCKDQRTAELLDTAASVKNRYHEQAQTISESLLLNALNLLNQADTQYRTSKNQRLSLELAFIKLCHLQETMESVAEYIAEAGKKKA